MLRRATLALALLLTAAAPALAQKGTPGGTPSFRLENNTPNIVNNVYASPTSVNSWGQDQLGANEVIQATGSREFQLPPGDCVYDIRVVYQGGVAEERRRVDVCNESIIALPLAAQRLAR